MHNIYIYKYIYIYNREDEIGVVPKTLTALAA